MASSNFWGSRDLCCCVSQIYINYACNHIVLVYCNYVLSIVVFVFQLNYWWWWWCCCWRVLVWYSSIVRGTAQFCLTWLHGYTEQLFVQTHCHPAACICCERGRNVVADGRRRKGCVAAQVSADVELSCTYSGLLYSERSISSWKGCVAAQGFPSCTTLVQLSAAV